MLEKALADEPDNVDLGVALAALQLRGIQMVWYSPDDARAAEAKAGEILERALKAKPDSIPVLETYCRFLSATNRFVESLVACSRGAEFRSVERPRSLPRRPRADPPRPLRRRARDIPASRPFRHAAGVALDVAAWRRMGECLMGRDEDAVAWLQRSIAITPASGRTHMLLAAAYQR